MQGMVPLSGFGGVPYSAVRKAAPRNLLDNSDFRNPVNQRGKTSITIDSGYMPWIDRWLFTDWSSQNGVLTATANGISVGNTDISFYQRFEKGVLHQGGKYTLVLYISGENPTIYNEAISFGDTFDSIGFTVTSGKTIYAAALYSGEYTSETLPEYHPRGYGAEFAECIRYYYRNWDGELDSSKLFSVYVPVNGRSTSIVFPAKMRVNPTITLYNPVSGREGVVGNWTDDSDVNASVLYLSNRYFILGGDVQSGSMYELQFEASAEI